MVLYRDVESAQFKVKTVKSTQLKKKEQDQRDKSVEKRRHRNFNSGSSLDVVWTFDRDVNDVFCTRPKSYLCVFISHMFLQKCTEEVLQGTNVVKVPKYNGKTSYMSVVKISFIYKGFNTQRWVQVAAAEKQKQHKLKQLKQHNSNQDQRRRSKR